MTRVGPAAVAALLACALIAGGCDSDSAQSDASSVATVAATTTIAAASVSAMPTSETPSSVASTAPSTASATTIASSTSSGPPPSIPAGAGPEAACAPGEQPLVFAYEQTSGSLRWARCTPEAFVPMVVGATEELVYAVLTKEDRSDYTKSLGRLVALDTTTGAQRWSADVGPNAMVSDGSLDGAGVLVVLPQGVGSTRCSASTRPTGRFAGDSTAPINIRLSPMTTSSSCPTFPPLQLVPCPSLWVPTVPRHH